MSGFGVPSTLVNVPVTNLIEFQLTVAQLQSEPIDINPIYNTVDIDASELQYLPPSVEIERAIERELATDIPELDPNTPDPERVVRRYLLHNSPVPTVADLEAKVENSPLLAVKQKRMIDKGPRRRRKQVNYLPAKNRGTSSEPFPSSPQPSQPTDPIDPSEIVITVALYHNKRPQKTQGFKVLGSQTLTALRDRLYCLNDHIPILDGPSTKSGYFFIENTFYSDMRGDRIDLAAYVIPWLTDKKRLSNLKEPPMEAKTLRMEEVRFIDLDIAIGKKYLYTHQGDCEHFLVFEEIRQIMDGDSLSLSDYPLQVYQCKISRSKCQICNIFPGKYVTYGDKLAPDSPALFCEDCYRKLHYSKNNQLLYSDFSVFDYHHK